ncbi:MAG: hypothetical protein JWM16_5748 [Verrucomicrobiales bacterium]|nr:hypothetical protein [Verrucomicrobiales bacterium]
MKAQHLFILACAATVLGASAAEPISSPRKLTITKVEPSYSVGNLEFKLPLRLTPPARGSEVTLMQRK